MDIIESWCRILMSLGKLIFDKTLCSKSFRLFFAGVRKYLARQKVFMGASQMSHWQRIHLPMKEYLYLLIVES